MPTTDPPADGAPFELTDSQWEVVRTTDEHLLVAASAGTGKTQTVIAKMLYLLGVPVRGVVHPAPLQIGEIAAITFTNRAAAELTERLRCHLLAAGRRDEAYRVETARVGTIHAFCIDVLQEFALRGGARPRHAQLDEIESHELATECAHDALLAALDDGPDAPSRVPGLDALVATLDVGEIEACTRTLLEDGSRLAALCAEPVTSGVAEQALLRLAERARDLVERRLRERRAIDFDRMILWTRDLIRDHPAVRRTLQRRIRTLIIDEFQDVDPVQQEIAYLLGDPGSRRRDTTRLVLVGDPKQSIYRFRHADVRGWNRVERDFADGGAGRVMALSENWRSVPALLGFADAVLGPILDEPVDAATGRQAFEVPYAVVRPRRAEGARTHAIELFVIPDPPDGEKAPKVDVVRACEAAAVARRARALHDEEHVPWRDMAVLFPTWTPVALYRSALEAEGVPCFLLRNNQFFRRPEIVDALVALRAACDPTDDRALVGFLRSPFVGVSDDTLLRVARSAPAPRWAGIADVAIPDPADGQRLRAGEALLRQAAELRDRVPPRALLQWLLDESGYLAHLALQGDSQRQAIANVLKLGRMVAERSERELAGMLRAFDRARSSEAKEGEAPLCGEHDDVVTITTVHSAKGLEWGVVFWCDLVRTRQVDSARVAIGDRSLAIAERHVAAEKQSAHVREIRRALQDEAAAEGKRLWYVAATRARDLLVLGGIPTKCWAPEAPAPRTHSKPREGGAACPADAIASVLPAPSGEPARIAYVGADGRTWDALVHRLELSRDVQQSSHDQMPDVSLDPPLAPLESQVGSPRHSATELLLASRCERKHWFRYVAGLPEPRVSRHASGGAAGRGELDAIRRGLIVHDVLEHWDEGASLDALIDDAMDDVPGERPGCAPDAGVRASLAEEVESLLAHPDYRAVFGAPGARRELRFLRIHSPVCYTEGAIDLIAPGSHGYSIVDVKTSDCDADIAKEKALQYEIQRATYVDAVEAITGAGVAHFGFQFSRAGVEVGGAVTPDARAAMHRQLDAALAELSTDAAALTRYPSECRFCGYHSAGLCAGVAAAPAPPVSTF